MFAMIAKALVGLRRRAQLEHDRATLNPGRRAAAAVATFGCLLATGARAEPPTVHFAGFAMVEGHTENLRLFPYTQELLDQSGPLSRLAIGGTIEHKIDGVNFTNLRVAGELGDYKR